MEKMVFATRKPSIVDRIRGYFQRRAYMRKWKREEAERYAVMSQYMAERRLYDRVISEHRGVCA